MTNELARVEPQGLAAVKGRRADQNPAAVYLARLAPSGRRGMRRALETIAFLASGGAIPAEAFPWGALRYQHAAVIKAKLTEGRRYAPATVNKFLAALRGVLREAWRLGQLGAEEYHQAIEVGGVKNQALPRGRAITAGELRALMDTCATDSSAAGARDAAVLAVLYGCGLRRSEAAGLRLCDVDLDTGAVTVQHGKGDKARVTYLDGGALDALRAWANTRGPAPGPFLCPVTSTGAVILRTISPQALYFILDRLAREAGVEHFSPHDLRRTFVSDLLDAGADIVTVQKLAGHAEVGTTARYDRRGDAAKRKAATLLHLPYQRHGAADPANGR